MRLPSSARCSRALCSLLAGVSFGLGSAGPARGQEDPSAGSEAAEPRSANATELARQRFREATQAYQEGRYLAAASLFEAADRLRPNAIVRYNVATAWEQAGEEARAATNYEAALGMDTLDPNRSKTARERLVGLQRRLGRLQIREPLGAFVTVDHVQRAPVPLTFYLRPGSYEISAEYRGEESTIATEVSAGDDLDVDLHLAVETAAAPPAVSPDLPSRPPRPVDDGGMQKTWGWVSVGAGVALSGVAVFLGVRALNARDRFLGSGNTNAGARQEASELRLATNLFWGGATLAGTTGLVLLLTAPTVEF